MRTILIKEAGQQTRALQTNTHTKKRKKNVTTHVMKQAHNDNKHNTTRQNKQRQAHICIYVCEW